MCPKDADWMTNSVDSEQTAPEFCVYIFSPPER